MTARAGALVFARCPAGFATTPSHSPQLMEQLVRRKSVTFEDLGLLLMNPFLFFATAYQLLNANHHDWMGAFAIGMSLLYAGAAKVLLDRSAATRSESLTLIGVALTFLTIAMPIQLRQNWITIAWSVEPRAITAHRTCSVANLCCAGRVQHCSGIDSPEPGSHDSSRRASNRRIQCSKEYGLRESELAGTSGSAGSIAFSPVPEGRNIHRPSVSIPIRGSVSPEPSRSTFWVCDQSRSAANESGRGEPSV